MHHSEILVSVMMSYLLKGTRSSKLIIPLTLGKIGDVAILVFDKNKYQFYKIIIWAVPILLEMYLKNSQEIALCCAYRPSIYQLKPQSMTSKPSSKQ